MPKFLIYLCALVGLAFCAGGSILLYNQVLRGRKQTEAEILGVEVEAYQDSNEDQTFTPYRAKYEVRYAVDGRVFQAPIRGAGLANPEVVQLMLPRNLVGSRRVVYYIPAKPEDVTVEPLGRRLGFSMLCLSIGATILAVAALLLYESQPLDW